MDDKIRQGRNFVIVTSVSFFLFSLIMMLSAYFAFHSGETAVRGEKLTAGRLRQAYTEYARYHESYVNIDDYLKHFPVEEYALYKVKNFAYFYSEGKEDIIKSRLRHGQRWEPYLLKYMVQYVRKNSNVLDIGAHIGTHTVFLSKLLGGQGMVWAFEPQKKLFMELNANLSVNHAKHVKTLRYAVGKKKSVITMNPAVNGNEGGTSIGQGGDHADLVTLDSLGINNVSFIKIDVEHYEDEVLAGAVKTIQASRPVILCEIMGGYSVVTASPEVKKKILHTIATLESLGYTVTRVRGADYLAVPVRRLSSRKLMMPVT